MSAGFGHPSNEASSQAAVSFLPGLQVNADAGNQVNDFGPVIAVIERRAYLRRLEWR